MYVVLLMLWSYVLYYRKRGDGKKKNNFPQYRQHTLLGLQDSILYLTLRTVGLLVVPADSDPMAVDGIINGRRRVQREEGEESVVMKHLKFSLGMEDELAHAGRDGRIRLARSNSQERTGKKNRYYYVITGLANRIHTSSVQNPVGQ